MDYAKMAKMYGGSVIEQPTAQPAQPDWMGGLSPKDQAELTMKMYNDDRKRVAALDDEISKGSSVLNDLQRFGELNRQSRTGGIAENLFPGTPILHGNDENEMYAIQARLGPSQRAVGSGASSDRDVALFLSGLPKIENPGTVNKNIRLEYEKRFNRAVSKKTAMENYLSLNGNLNGFDDFWSNQSKPKQTVPTKRKMMSPKFLGFEGD